MRAAGVTENHAIRTLELFADVYAKMHNGGSATPHHVSQVPIAQWSLAAQSLFNSNPEGRPMDYLRVEHGTPRRAFARLVLDLYRSGDLSEQTMADLVKRWWKLAVITLEEDARLNKVARSALLNSPDERWQMAAIKFQGNSP
jgi:hypothetical protein